MLASSTLQHVCPSSVNAHIVVWHTAGEVKVGIFALTDIPVGEELSYDYQFQHYGLAQAAGAYRSVPCKSAHEHDCSRQPGI